jgi:hypothetical protein
MRTNGHAAPPLENRIASAFANQNIEHDVTQTTVTNWIKRGHAINEAGRIEGAHDRCSMDFPVCSGEN